MCGKASKTLLSRDEDDSRDCSTSRLERREQNVIASKDAGRFGLQVPSGAGRGEGL